MSERQRRPWHDHRAPIGGTLYRVVRTKHGAFAVGSGGTALARTAGGAWRVVLGNGPGGGGNTLYGLDVTDDGTRVWFAGASGTLGRYDYTDDATRSHVSPRAMTSTWSAVAVTGKAGSETVYLTNTSGEVLRGRVSDDHVEWTVASDDGDGDSLGSGASITSLALDENGRPVVVNSAGRVFRERESGWEAVGIDGAGSTLNDVIVADQQAFVTTSAGRVFRRRGGTWHGTNVAPGALRGIDVRKGRVVAVGDSGRVYRRTGDGRWSQQATPIGSALRDVSLGHPDLAVGSSGRVLTHAPPRSKQPSNPRQSQTAQSQQPSGGRSRSARDGPKKP
ncbi:hypothetical protein [Halarchaeum sp. P4]|uniref:hypothetical protein n=1 Tax=Halarchaeum sp. P4 TaxID=3421639 RepID=UPI003EB785D3